MARELLSSRVGLLRAYSAGLAKAERTIRSGKGTRGSRHDLGAFDLGARATEDQWPDRTMIEPGHRLPGPGRRGARFLPRKVQSYAHPKRLQLPAIVHSGRGKMRAHRSLRGRRPITLRRLTAESQVLATCAPSLKGPELLAVTCWLCLRTTKANAPHILPRSWIFST